MNKFKMQNFSTSCSYTQIKELLKGETQKPFCGSDILNRLLLAIERERGRKERKRVTHPGPVFGLDILIILF